MASGDLPISSDMMAILYRLLCQNLRLVEISASLGNCLSEMAMSSLSPGVGKFSAVETPSLFD